MTTTTFNQHGKQIRVVEHTHDGRRLQIRLQRVGTEWVKFAWRSLPTTAPTGEVKLTQ